VTGGFGNYRDTMPLNGRTVSLLEAVADDKPLTLPEAAVIPAVPVAATGREARAVNMARDALTIARASVDYVRDLERRFQEAHGPSGGAAAAPGPTTARPSVPSPEAPADPALGAAAQPAVQTGALRIAANTAAASIAAAAKEAAADAMKQVSAEAEAVADDKLPPMPDAAVIPALPIAATGREARAVNMARDALTIARASADYARDLDRRLRGVAEAHQPLGGVAAAPGHAVTRPSAPSPAVPAEPVVDTAAQQTHMLRIADAPAASIAAAAKEAVADAMKQVSAEAEVIARAAARNAAKAIMQEIAREKLAK